MTKPRPDPYPAVPQVALLWRSLIWLLLPLCALAALLSGVAFLISAVQVPSYNQIQGELRPEADAVALSLPAQGVLDSILVRRGDTLQAGQTVALLDIAAMERQKARLERAVLNAVLLRDCLLSLPAEASVEFQAQTSAQHHNETVSNSNLAETPPGEYPQLAEITCTTFRSTFDMRREELASKQAVIGKEATLVQSYLALLSARSADKHHSDSKSRALQAVALNLARNRLRGQILELETASAHLKQQVSQKTLEKIETTNAEIARHQDQIALLNRHISQPRILAPVAGKILRLRPSPKGVTLSEETEIADMRPTDQRGYEARFSAPAHLADAMAPGTQVSLQLLGSRFSAPNLNGKIGAVKNGGNGKITVQVHLHEASIAWLDSPQTGVALRGRFTATQVHVQKRAVTPLAAVAQRLLSTFLRSSGAWEAVPF